MRSFSLSIFIILLIILKNENKQLFPSILTLLNQKNVLVTNDGIHFYDSNLENEEIEKYVSLYIPSEQDNYKTAMTQLSVEDNGYIIILVMNIIYFFEADGNFIISSDISNLINGEYYCLTPYKKENNYLNYIISYINSTEKKLILHHFKFDIYYHNNEQETLKNIQIKIQDSNDDPSELVGDTCLFLFDSSNNNILTCFYLVSHPVQIQSRSFDPNENFNELTSKLAYYTISELDSNPPYISGITNLDKKKALIYISGFGTFYWLLFDFDNNFYSFSSNECSDLHTIYPKNKFFFFRQNHEFVALSQMDNCKVYLIVFNNDFTMKAQTLFNPSDQCYNSYFSTLYFNGIYYVIVTDSQNPDDNQFFINSATSLGISIRVEEPIEIRSIEPSENEENYSNNIKCKFSTFDSSLYDLCTLCNIEKGYFPAEIKDTTFFHNYVECFNNDTKPVNFYFNRNLNKYKICYETCLTCNEDGDEYNNNCLSCDSNHIKKPEYPNSKNCVTKCLYLYYYTDYGQYKCSNSSVCPEEANLYIQELKKCTNDCSKEVKYKYQYGGICIENCPNNTKSNINNICIDIIESCSKTERITDIQEFLTSGGVDVSAKNYAKEFGYTEKHVSFFYNNQYSIILYQELNCLDELSINLAKIDFGTCYTKIQQSINQVNKKIIIGLIEKLNGKQKSTISFSFYHPVTGQKLDVYNICKDEEIVIKESVMSQLNSTDFDLNSLLFLTQQNINIFNLSDEFYTDICYHFESPNGKDIPLKERIHIFFPNITLCDSGCQYKGINLAKMESICECKYINMLKNEFVEKNIFIESSVEEITDIISNSNLDVLKCFKDVFKIEYIQKGIGGFFIISIFIIEIIFSIIFLIYDKYQIMRYLYNISEQYINLLSKNINFTKRFSVTIIKAPPKKRRNKDKKIKKECNIFNNSTSQKSDNLLKKNKTNNVSSNAFKNENNSQNRKEKLLLNYNKKEKKDIIKNQENYSYINDFLKTDLDDMAYDDAVKLDKRKFLEYLTDRLKEKQMIINIFYKKNNITPTSIKIILFALNIDLYFVINGLFFNEDYIIELYHLEEEDSFFSYFPRSINRFLYSTLVSKIVGIIIDCIIIEEKKVKRLFLREKDDILNLRYEISMIVKKIRIRYIVFIFINFFITIISWYYVNCFNNVYKGVKIEWIKSSITLIIIIILLSLILAILEAVLREISFKCKSEKIFKLKELIP